MKNVLIAMLTLAACMCTVSDGTIKRVGEAAGLHDVKPGGPAPFLCSERDWFRSHFTAKNAEGKPVSGVVCCGVLKNCTVRWD